MMRRIRKSFLLLFLFLQLYPAFLYYPIKFHKNLFQKRWNIQNNPRCKGKVFSLTSTLTTEESAEVSNEPLVEDLSMLNSSAINSTIDFSKFSVGQEVMGDMIRFNSTYMFVQLSGGETVLIRKRKMDNFKFQKLRMRFEASWLEPVKVIITELHPEQNLLIGKYYELDMPELWKELLIMQRTGEQFDVTITDVLDYGLQVHIHKLQKDALIPLSKLPIKQNIRQVYPKGTRLVARVDTCIPELDKLYLGVVSRAPLRKFLDLPPHVYFPAVIQSVKNDVGLFVRPAGYDEVGIIRKHEIPFVLIQELRRQLRDRFAKLEDIFRRGDVVRVRMKTIDLANQKSEFSMMEYHYLLTRAGVINNNNTKAMRLLKAKENVTINFNADEFDEDRKFLDGVRRTSVSSRSSEGRDGIIVEGFLEKPLFKPNSRFDEVKYYYNPYTTLMWWKGKKFENPYPDDGMKDYGNEIEFNPEAHIAVKRSFRDKPHMTESEHLVRMQWRRYHRYMRTKYDREGERKKLRRMAYLRRIEKTRKEVPYWTKQFNDMSYDPNMDVANEEFNHLGCYVDWDKFPEEWKESEWYKKYAHTFLPEKIRDPGKVILEEIEEFLAENNLPGFEEVTQKHPFESHWDHVDELDPNNPQSAMIRKKQISLQKKREKEQKLSAAAAAAAKKTTEKKKK